MSTAKNLNLCVYRNILNDSVMRSLRKLLHQLAAPQFNAENIGDSYHEFIYHLLLNGHSFQEHLLSLIIHDDNPFTCQAEKYGAKLDDRLREAVIYDIKQLEAIYHYDLPAKLKANTGLDPESLSLCPWHFAPREENEKVFREMHSSANWAENIDLLADYCRKQGRGLVSSGSAFNWDARNSCLQKINDVDLPSLDDLLGYDSQKEEICRNTEMFLAGGTANHLLLYGSSGTGKSTMIRAILNQYQTQGLKMVEISREDLSSLSQLIAIIREYQSRFIIFIDDLSFEDYESSYKGLKASMEGSLTSAPRNVLVYATSNRRHLVKEYFSDRERNGDEEVNISDTFQEKISISQRFGLTITLPSPGQQEYLNIVEKLVKEQHLDADPEWLRQRALQWERFHHGLSGRTAQQFINSLEKHDPRQPLN